MKLTLLVPLLAAVFAAPARAGEVKPKPAPQLPHQEWLNTPENKPLRIEQLRGKVVLVAFWTYG